MKKYVVNIYPSKPWKDYLFGLRLDGVWKSDWLFRLTSLDFPTGFFIQHYKNKFRKLIAKYSNDLNGHKGYKSKKILPFISVILSPQKPKLQWWLLHLPWLSNCLSLFDTELMKREWIAGIGVLKSLNVALCGMKCLDLTKECIKSIRSAYLI